MSRPSRGFSIPHGSTSVGPACPAEAFASLTILADDDYVITVTWFPDVVVPTGTLWGSVNGDPPFVMQVGGPVNSGTTFAFSPYDYASSGDELDCFMVATDVIGCADFQSNQIDIAVP